jgi:hypothetical protein
MLMLRGESRAGAAFIVVLAVAALTLFPTPAGAFWLLGFSTADTLPPGAVGAIAGTGGQYSRVGSPAASSFTPFLAHAGFRLGVTDGFDVGYRLVQVPLPFSSVGPSLGSEIDGRVRLTSPGAPWQVAAVAGVAYSYLELSGVSKNAWSPGADLMLSHAFSPRYTLISELRYVYTEITDAPGGAVGNHLHAAGGDVGARIMLTPSVSLIPEVGLFDFSGNLGGRTANGFGAQYGVVLSYRLW